MDEDDVSTSAGDAAIEVQRTLGGPGLPKPVCEEALAFELGQRGLGMARQAPVPIACKSRLPAHALMLDVLVKKIVILEITAGTGCNTIFESQLPASLRLSLSKFGLAVNFGATLLKSGIHRLVNHLSIPCASAPCRLCIH